MSKNKTLFRKVIFFLFLIIYSISNAQAVRNYSNEFLKTLRIKVLDKVQKFPEFKVDKDKLLRAKNFRDFDELYTAPAFGFDSPEDYWIKASSKPYISKIKKPVFLISALDDPFLPKDCYPYEEAQSMNNFFLETPKYGGHVGFMSSFKHHENIWLERRILKSPLTLLC